MNEIVVRKIVAQKKLTAMQYRALFVLLLHGEMGITKMQEYLIDSEHTDISRALRSLCDVGLVVRHASTHGHVGATFDISADLLRGSGP